MDNNDQKMDILNSCSKIIIKIGSSTVTDSYGKIDTHFLKKLSKQCKKLIDDGKK